MSKPLFEQIYETYKKYILIGVYKEGDKLPSVREIASNYGINPNTVNRAIKMLEEDHLVETILKKGSFVKSNNLNLEKELEKELIKYKDSGISFNKINNILKKVYGDDND